VQVADARRECELLQAKTWRLQRMLIKSQPYEEDLINTIQKLERVSTPA
jgi:hypothetical protein